MSVIKICFIGKRNSYEKLFYENIEDRNLKITFLKDEIVAGKIPYFDKLHPTLRKHIQFNYFRNYLKKNTDTHFIFHERTKTLKRVIKYLKKYGSKDFKGYLLIRNPMNTRKSELLAQINFLKSLNIYVGTFDYEDAKTFNIKLYKQYASKLNALSLITCNYDFGFLGKNKNRKGHLESVEKTLNNLNFTTNFKIIDLDSQRIPYVEYLKFIIASKCFVDIVQEKQSGLTLRPIEALLYNRKLLTNNRAIKNEDFFHPSNIMVFNGENLDLLELKDFMEKPLKKIPKQIIDNYKTGNVLKNIIASHSYTS